MSLRVTFAGMLCFASAVFATPGFATEAGLEVIKQTDCAVFAAMISHAKEPLPARVMAPALASERTDEHFRRALTLGVPLIEAGGNDFPGLMRPEAFGGSAEAGMGRYYAEAYQIRNDLFKLERGEPDRGDKGMDKRFEALREWYRLRAAVMQGEYDAKGCDDLPRVSQ
ncbi:hypothetical protein [Paracoccus marinaquae]|uniref:Uncharacterized protein n=1 Tax=Paracoccus marinaquae TaxID=2841926 RepID=A0ABS6AN68_9RHOB|nr:hypothetical protein [Paracoccus marinaquae]MBU3032038.1 hypothetical protein [Paracoccus marinaquae]